MTQLYAFPSFPQTKNRLLYCCYGARLDWLWASLVAQRVKSLPAMQETQVPSLDLEKGLATHSSILAWEIPQTQEPSGLQSMGLQKSQTQLSN